MDQNQQPHSFEYEKVSSDYLQKRELKKGAAGWILLASLGVAYVISGDFSGWNFGLAQGGFGGLLIATIVMAIMYTCIALCLAELSSAIPTTGGGYGFARAALGPWGGFITGTAILIEYAIACAAIVVFIGGYVQTLTGIDGPVVYLSCYIVFIGLHLLGVDEALKIMLGITAIAVLAILLFAFGMLPYFKLPHLLDIAIQHQQRGANLFLPHGYVGIWAAIPFAIWFFLAVEGVPLAAEETHNPARDMPRGIITAMIILLFFAGIILFLAPGGSSATLIANSKAPLVEALQHSYGAHHKLPIVVNVIGLAGLIASFFSIIFAYSRQVFALSRAGYLPRFLSLTTKRKAPALALIIPGVIGFILCTTGQGDLLITIAVFGATISYAMMMLSHIMLRFNAPNLPRPYKTPAGVLTASIALVLSVIALLSTFLANLTAALWTAFIFALMLAYFGFYSRHHLVATAPEEELNTLRV